MVLLGLLQLLELWGYVSCGIVVEEEKTDEC